MKNLNADAVFEGGGVKGIGLAGAILAMEEAGYRWGNVAGTSAGAIVASLISVGYTGEEIRDMLFGVNFKNFSDDTLLTKIPIIGSFISISTMKGIYSGESIENWLREKYIIKGKKKFKDIKTVLNNGKYRYRLNVIASDVTRKRLIILPEDIKKYGIDPDELEIAKAVRMSISLPIFFKPVILKSSEGYNCYIVDGGLLSNFPVWLFDVKGIPKWPTFGFRFIKESNKKENLNMNTVQYILNIISTMMEAFDERYIEESNFKRTVAIPTLGVGTTEFGISKEKAVGLYDSGYCAAKKFLSTWDFNNYIRQYRIKNIHSSKFY